MPTADGKEVGDYTKYLRRPAGDRLQAGEDFLAATPCLPRGGISRRVIGAAAFGAAGDLIASSGANSAGPIYVGQELPSTMALGVTQQRVLVFGMNVATGRPKKVIYDIPLVGVAGVQSSTGRSVGMKKLNVDISLSNGALMQLEVPREHVKKGEAFVGALSLARDAAAERSVLTAPAASPVGWHEVPGDQYRQRYWDGTSWTQEIRWDGAAWVPLAPAP